MKAIADQVGYKSADAWVQYESDWVFETIADCKESKDFIKPFYTAEATDEERTTCLNLITKTLDILEGRFSDNRKYCAGD